MNLLLDTHIFIWAFSDVARLPSAAAKALLDPQNSLFLSTASSWEMQVKEQIGKLVLSPSVEIFIKSQMLLNQIRPLPINNEHVWILRQLPLHHRDPFDRLIIAKAMSEKIAIATKDDAFRNYAVETIW